MKIKGKNKEIIISAVFLGFIGAITAASFHYNNLANSGIKLSPPGKLASILHFLTTNLNLLGLILLVVFSASLIITIKHLKYIKRPGKSKKAI